MDEEEAVPLAHGVDHGLEGVGVRECVRAMHEPAKPGSGRPRGEG
jgi:hypothetical protein